MTWSRPISVWLAPALVLALGALTILFDGLGLETRLSNRLFDAYQRHCRRPRRARTSAGRWTCRRMDEDSLVRRHPHSGGGRARG